MTTTVIVDNGASMVKAAVVKAGSGEHSTIVSVPNAVFYRGKNILVGKEVFGAHNTTSMTMKCPVERGCLVDVELQALVWEQVLTSLNIVDENSTSLLVSVPRGAPDDVFRAIFSLAFDTFRFGAVTLVSSAFLALWDAHLAGTGVVVDSGHSSTTVTSFVNYKAVQHFRHDVGGKIISNRLKEMLSFAQLDVSDEPWLVNHIKEATSFVSLNFCAQLKEVMLPRLYVLPTSHHTFPVGFALDMAPRGFSPKGHQLLALRHEVFTLPELLFSPSDIGLHQCGCAEATSHALRALPCHLRATSAASIVLSGGNCNIRNFTERFIAEVTASCPYGVGTSTSTSSHSLRSVCGGIALAESIHGDSPGQITSALLTSLQRCTVTRSMAFDSGIVSEACNNLL
jgi:actin-related protein 6